MVTDSRTPLRAHRLRPLSLPRPLRVDVDEHDLPVAVFGERKRRVVEAVGEIWHIDDEWWRDRIARRYVEVILVDGGHLVLYQDLVNGGWYVQ